MRVALLGAARITPKAIVVPSRGFELELGVAARSEAKARAFASEHGLQLVYHDYEEALRDPGVSAVYLATPAAHHGVWIERALDLNKHVLCEKPCSLSLSEAKRLVEKAERLGLVLMEAHHSRFHPLWPRFMAAVAGLPDVEFVEALFHAPIAESGDIRLEPRLGAGVFLDFGGYLLSWLSWVVAARGGVDPWAIRVVDAEAAERPKEVDRSMRAQALLEIGQGQVSAEMACSMDPTTRFQAHVAVRSSVGEVVFDNPLALEGSQVRKTGPISEIWETPAAALSTYQVQLGAFLTATLGGPSPPHTGRDIWRLAALVDQVYQKAKLAPRGELARA